MKPDIAQSLKKGAVYRLLPAASLIIGLGSTFVVWYFARENFEIKERSAYERRRDQAKLLIDDKLEHQASLLRATAAAIVIDPDLDRFKFNQFASTLRLREEFPGLLGIGFAQLVAKDRVPAFEAEMRSQGWKGFRVKPADFQGDQFPIKHLEPSVVENVRALGFNMFSEPRRRQAMEQARDTGQPSMTTKLVLIQDEAITDEAGFLLYVPVYQKGILPKDVASRRKALLGFAYSPLRANDFFGEAFRSRSSPDVKVEIYTGPPEDPEQLLFEHVPTHFGNRSIEHVDTNERTIYGQPCTIRFSAPSYHAVVGGLEALWWIPITGSLISLLVFVGIRSQIKASEESRLQLREAERQADRDRFLSEVARVLGLSLDSSRLLDAVAQLAVPEFAEWCAVDVPDANGEPARLSVQHVDPSKIRFVHEITEKYPPDHDSPIGPAHVIRTGEPEWMREIPEELLTQSAKDEEHLRIIKDLGLKSYISVPVTVRGEVLAVISFVGTDPDRLYDDDDFRLAQDIASRTAVALDNARLYEAAHREVRERRRAEDQVRELNASLERLVDERTKELRATNMELEAFCYSVSHDLRTPLRSVDGFSKALLEDYGEILPDEAKGYLERVRRANHRMDELITALLNLSRITRAEIARETVNMGEVAEAALVEAARDIPPEVLQVDIKGDMCARADAKMVRIIYDNLLGNAIKFSSAKDRISIEVGEQKGVFFVRDHGVGFNPIYKAKLFTPFERLHSPKDFTGTGIGLATVQRIVHKHGGEIWAESEEGKGATFFFTLH